MSDLIARLRERAHDPARATDEAPGAGVGPAPPAPEAQVAAAERSLGFRLPALLRRVYLEVGDGGFGPGHGLPPLLDAAGADSGRSLAGRYAALRQEQAVPRWPAELVPLCDWGSGIASLLDCTRAEAPVVRLDPNMKKADAAGRVPAVLRYDRAALVRDACWVEAASLEGWLEAWADGKRLFYLAYGGADDDADDAAEEDEDDAGDEAD